MIVMDDREDLKMREILKELGLGFVVRRMKVGDYVVGGRVCIERKTMDDFCGSIMDGRLSKQVEQMKGIYNRVVVIVSGSIKDRESEIHENCIVGKIASLFYRWDVSVIMLDSDKQIGIFMRSLIKKIEEGKLK